ncbi:BCAS3 domain-containing protein [Heracleum sosnowskyi]|uniref:BCAS3 domain-containing protein n=1 Tax=Heracleum sosnowskyi TaxID=360622 RepID=A0AAD8JFN0_9APIA|nr:BCAS3 domain-containing protein [Heracleum sosnowskyi]
MRRNQNNNNKKKKENNSNGFVPNSLKLISSCMKTVSSNVRSASASVAASISPDSDHLNKDQVLCACFDRLELGPSVGKTLLLLGYSNGFQVLDFEDASNVTELVSRRDDAVTFLQMQPIPAKCDGREGFIDSHPLLLVVASEETRSSGSLKNGRDGSFRDNYEPHVGAVMQSPTAVRFYSLTSHSYVHVLRFRSAVYMVRCSSKIVAVGLTAQIYCFDALTLESMFSVLSYPVPHLGGQGLSGVNIGYGPMSVGPRWLAYASNNPLVSNTGRLSPQSLSPSPGVSPSTSPSNGNLVARYAMESSKQLATGLINLGDMGYRTWSKYCHELLPDGSSSPVPSSSSWKVGRTAAHSSDIDTAGTVVIKDFVSKAVVSQFRAHTSPISALCFDPSGTLLVTASIHGNNINIFRIMPSCLRNGSGTHSYDWNSSHVHLYKLHRGLTSAVIQDICFSPFSQWISIVSSRGTGHIFVLSPFGGETGLQMQNSNLSGPTLLPVLSLPWWSTSSYMLKQSYTPPPPPVTLSVVSRIKNSGWLNSVSNAASSAAGKLSAPSGVVAAIFHSSVGKLQPTTLNVNALEHLMVYTPSGSVIQYELLPYMGGDQGESSLRNETNSLGQVQDEDLKVKVGPVQWWDVCRRADWPEREESVGGSNRGRQDAGETLIDASDCEDDGTKVKDMVKHHDRFPWYLSNAEVQMRSGRAPIWQKSQVYVYALSPPPFGERRRLYCNDGEIEIEKLPAREIAIRRKELLPVTDHFHRIHPEWADRRDLSKGRYLPSSSFSDDGKEKYLDNACSHVKSVTPTSVDNSETGPLNSAMGLSKREYRTQSYPSFGPISNENDVAKGLSSLPKQNYIGGVDASLSTALSTTILSALEEDYVNNYTSYSNKTSPSVGNITQEVLSSSSVVTGGVSNTSSNRSDLSMNILDEELVHEDMQDQLDFGRYFQEEYCESKNLDQGNELTEHITDVNNSTSHCHKAISEEEADNDDMLGCVFAFSEEG